MTYQSRIGLLLATTLLSSCAIWPDYSRPTVEVPANYKEAQSYAGWKVAEPNDSQTNAEWWTIYGDTQLNTLLTEATQANLNIQQAEARYRQAEALSRVSRAALLPFLDGDASAKRGQSGGNSAQNTFKLGLNAGWEVDLWGRVKRSVETGNATLAATAADLNAAKLSIQASLAQSYFQLRVLDSQKRLLDDTATAYEKSLKLINNRYNVGLASRTEIAQAETQLRATRAQAVDISAQRAQLEHAIAVLAGRSPADFSLTSLPLENGSQLKLPIIPASLPSALLERRPDIAAAERRAAAANAQIGIAKAALFPSLNLNGSIGFQSNFLADLISVPSRIWSLGPQLAVSIFDGGQRKGQTDAAIAAYDANIAIYKQTILTGFQEVEDNLSTLRLLEQEAVEQESAVRFARESVQQTENRYKAGTVDYLSVVTVQTTALNNERSLLSLQARRLIASVNLVKALGGPAHSETAGNKAVKN